VIPSSPRSPFVSTCTFNTGFFCRIPFETRCTVPVSFCKTKILLLSIKSILVGKDNPSVTNSTFRELYGICKDGPCFFLCCCIWPIIIFTRLKWNATIIIVRITIIIETDKTKSNFFFFLRLLSSMLLLIELVNSVIKTREGLSTLRQVN
jgi:hypothetical protein